MASYASWERWFEDEAARHQLRRLFATIDFNELCAFKAMPTFDARLPKPGTQITLRRWLNPIGDRMQYIDRAAMAD